MVALFGTDGIRGIAGKPPLDRDTVYRVGYCLTEYLRHLAPSPHILIGRDTRESGPWLEVVLRRAIQEAGGLPELCGVISTPAISFLTPKTGAHAGIMISASHNPYRDNGIKVFASTGMKFNDDVEEDLERRIASSSLTAPPESAATGAALLASVPEYCRLYSSFLRQCVSPDCSLEGVRLVVDCAHGALSAIAPEFFRALGAEVRALHCEPDGHNINRKAGALHVERLQQEVLDFKAYLGIAFDGDADRAMFVDSRGVRRDGDDVLYLLGRFSDFQGGPRVVVGTVMANLGLEVALESLGIRLVRTSVGDRYVLEEMLRLGAMVGGEQSGHVILLRLARTGDGLLTALKVIEALRQQKAGMEDLWGAMRRFPQVLRDVPVRSKVPFDEIPGLRETEAFYKEKLGPRSRILMRYSGTERLARIMVEGEDRGAVTEAAARLAAHFDSLRP